LPHLQGLIEDLKREAEDNNLTIKVDQKGVEKIIEKALTSYLSKNLN